MTKTTLSCDPPVEVHPGGFRVDARPPGLARLRFVDEPLGFLHVVDLHDVPVDPVWFRPGWLRCGEFRPDPLAALAAKAGARSRA